MFELKDETHIESNTSVIGSVSILESAGESAEIWGYYSTAANKTSPDMMTVLMSEVLSNTEPFLDAGQINGPSIRSSGSSSFSEFKSEFSSSITVGSPVINLQPLEAKCSAADDLSDGVQSMDVR